MRTAWFTFGQIHVHSVNGRTFDKDTVVEITSEDPRAQMFETFGRQWAMEYDEPPDMRFFEEIVRLETPPQRGLTFDGEASFTEDRT